MNKYTPHVYVVPEDDANRQIADGFVLHHRVLDRRIQVVPPSGGWRNVLKSFQDEYIPALRKHTQSHVILLIDFDSKGEARYDEFAKAIPDDIRGRVFVVGSEHDPETLRRAFAVHLDEIGLSLAHDCDEDTTSFWGHEQLLHNESERQRLIQTVKPFLLS